MAERAAAALCRTGTVRLDPFGRRLQNFFYSPKGIRFGRLQDTDSQTVAGRRTGNKYGDPLCPAHAAALRGHACDLYFNYLILFQKHRFLSDRFCSDPDLS